MTCPIMAEVLKLCGPGARYYLLQDTKESLWLRVVMDPIHPQGAIMGVSRCWSISEEWEKDKRHLYTSLTLQQFTKHLIQLRAKEH